MPATPTLAPFRYAPRIFDQGRAKEWGFADPRSLPLCSNGSLTRRGLKGLPFSHSGRVESLYLQKITL